MQLIVKIKRFQLYLCIGKVYDINRDGWARQGFTVVWLGEPQRKFSRTWA